MIILNRVVFPVPLRDFLKNVRFEWGVESMHWLLDVHFDEDHTRTFNDNTQKNLNIIRKIALNLISDYKKLTDCKSLFPVLCVLAFSTLIFSTISFMLWLFTIL